MKLPTTNEEMEAIYERYVRPLEREHWGKFVAVSLDRQVLLGNEELPEISAEWDVRGAVLSSYPTLSTPHLVLTALHSVSCYEL